MSVPFRGDHIGLRRNPLWKDVLTKNSLHKMDRYVVFADIVNKINRSNGKVCGVSEQLVWCRCSVRVLATNQSCGDTTKNGNPPLDALLHITLIKLASPLRPNNAGEVQDRLYHPMAGLIISCRLRSPLPHC